MQLAEDAGILRSPRIKRHRLRDIFDESNLPPGNDDISRAIADPRTRGIAHVYSRRSSRDIVYIFYNPPCSKVLGTKARVLRVFERNRESTKIASTIK